MDYYNEILSVAFMIAIGIMFAITIHSIYTELSKKDKD